MHYLAFYTLVIALLVARRAFGPPVPLAHATDGFGALTILTLCVLLVALGRFLDDDA